jgi:hypothetical protein
VIANAAAVATSRKTSAAEVRTRCKAAEFYGVPLRIR